MGIGQQQPIRDTVDEICTDVSRTIYAIFSENMNYNTLELLRLKLDVQKTVGNLNKFVKVLRKHNKEILALLHSS